MIVTGTSGFNYKHWIGNFYPQNLPSARWLPFYAGNFPTVELNVTFYRLPKKSVFENWAKETPDNFVFSVKGSRLITQYYKLLNIDDALCNFFSNASGLGSKLGIVLWQFPPNFHFQEERLENFCQILRNKDYSKNIRGTFEFRDNSWFNQSTYQILKKYQFSLCFADSKKWPTPLEVTTDYLYFRFHGSNSLYTSKYSQKELEFWAKRIKKLEGQKKDIFIYFNNDAMGYAISNAKELSRLINRFRDC